MKSVVSHVSEQTGWSRPSASPATPEDRLVLTVPRRVMRRLIYHAGVPLPDSGARPGRMIAHPAALLGFTQDTLRRFDPTSG